MIRVKILNAKNLPTPTKHTRKTRIYCLSSSSQLYFYESYKNKENTTNPEWNSEFETDLYHCNTLSFLLYSSKLFTREIFLGRSDINLPNFFLQEEGKLILKNPYSQSLVNLPITNCTSSNSTLSIMITFFPTVYAPLKFESNSKSVLHIFATYSPSIELSSESIQNNQVEIEVLQAYFTEEKSRKKTAFYKGLYYVFNKKTQWDTIGSSSFNHYVIGQSGLTQIHSISLERIQSKYEFFILDVSNFKGVVTLNIISEQEGKLKTINDQQYFQPKNSKNKKGTLKTVDVLCEPNHKYCFPLYLYYEKKIIKKNIFELNYTSSIYSSYEKSSEDKSNEFYSQIIEKAKSNIPQLENVNFMRTNVLNHSEKISLLNVFNDLNLNINFKLRIYVGGSTTYQDEEGSDADYWEPFFIIYDKKSCKRNEEIEKTFLKKPFYNSPVFTSKKPIFGMKWNSYVNLNLDQFDINQVIVFAVYCDASLESADCEGFYLISQVNTYDENDNDNNETLLFRNLIFADKKNSHILICFKFEFIEDCWEIIPMKFYFTKKKKMDSILDSLFTNNWVLPEIISNRINYHGYDSSDDEKLIENVEQ